MNTIANLKKVSLLFFLILAGTHIVSSLLLAKGSENPTILILNEILDLPAILAGILYAFTSLKSYLEKIGKETKWFDTVAGCIAGIFLIVSIYFNFFHSLTAAQP